MIAYKLLRVRKDGTLGPLFVERSRVLPVGKYLGARMDLQPKALATRPGCSELVEFILRGGQLVNRLKSYKPNQPFNQSTFQLNFSVAAPSGQKA